MFLTLGLKGLNFISVCIYSSFSGSECMCKYSMPKNLTESELDSVTTFLCCIDLIILLLKAIPASDSILAHYNGYIGASIFAHYEGHTGGTIPSHCSGCNVINTLSF
jgi:hypothetical protein